MLYKEKEQGVDNIWYVAKDRRKETTESHDVERKVTQAPRAGSRSLQNEGQEQAGFRRGRGCIDQIFVLRNIIEQCIEWNTPLYINFIDFRKDFDSVQRDTLWKILRLYGVPPKIVTLMELFYQQCECSVIVDGNLSEWFCVESGVRQGCFISPILFLVAIDWIMRRKTADRPRGTQWTLFSQLEDLDFADDLAALSTTRCHLQEKTDRLRRFARQVGLNINNSKT